MPVRRRALVRTDQAPSAEARAAWARSSEINREMVTISRDAPDAQVRLHALAMEKRQLGAVTRNDWLRRCRP